MCISACIVSGWLGLCVCVCKCLRIAQSGSLMHTATNLPNSRIPRVKLERAVLLSVGQHCWVVWGRG